MQNVGCDFIINSEAMEDHCGVCQGNGSTCRTMNITFDETEGSGVYGEDWRGVDWEDTSGVFRRGFRDGTLWGQTEKKA